MSLVLLLYKSLMLSKSLLSLPSISKREQPLFALPQINNKLSSKDLIIQSHLPLRFDFPSGIAHNKVIIIDHSTVLSGSYNFSSSAYTRNTENLLTLNSPGLAKEYIHNWLKRWDVSI